MEIRARRVPSSSFPAIGIGLLLLAAAGPLLAAPPAGGAVPVTLDLDAELNHQFAALEAQIGNRRWHQRIADQAYRAEALIARADRDPTDVILRRTEALAAHLKTLPGGPALTAELAQLRQIRAAAEKTDVIDAGARRALFTTAGKLRRRIALANPLLNFDELLFVKSHRSRANHCCDQYFGSNATPGGSVHVLSGAFGPKPALRDVLADSFVRNGRLKGTKLNTGSFRSPELSYDGKVIYFAYSQCGRSRQRWSPERSFHVFSVNVDGSNLRQLTDGTWNDFDPCCLPSGRIAFISGRRGGFGRCHPRPVPTYTLHSMNPDGSDIVPLSYHETNEWHPSVDNNGMIVYTRWDYIDRGDCIAHHPWITYPDGRDPRAIHGNYPSNRGRRPDQETDIRAIPDSPLYVATATPHHGQAYGSLVVFDPRVADDDAMAPVKRVTPWTPFPETEGGGQMYATAWPLSEDFFLCVYTAGASRGRGRRGAHGVYLLDSFGNEELLYADPRLGCLGPIPLRPRKSPPVIPHQTAVGIPASAREATAAWAGKKTPTAGTVVCVNVYNSLKPWPKDTKVKSLRVIQLFPKATVPINRPDMGIGSESLARSVLGTVPVEADGSVHMTLPARKLVYFQALDADGLAVQSMQSATYVHPGETLTCQGCHEPRHGAPELPRRPILAAQRPPSVLTGEGPGTDPVLYPLLVQPVLDRYCVPCHTKKAKAPKLDGKPARWQRSGYGGGNITWTNSYITLTTGRYNEGDVIKGFAFSFSARPPGRTPTRTTPGSFGARASRLYQMLQKGHHKVKLPPEDLRRITLWLDCNSLFFGAYHDLDKQIAGQSIRPPLE